MQAAHAAAEDRKLLEQLGLLNGAEGGRRHDGGATAVWGLCRERGGQHRHLRDRGGSGAGVRARIRAADADSEGPGSHCCEEHVERPELQRRLAPPRVLQVSLFSATPHAACPERDHSALCQG